MRKQSIPGCFSPPTWPGYEATYKLANKESGHSFKCSAFNHKRVTMYAYRNSLPTNSLEYCMNDNIQWSCWPWKLMFLTAQKMKEESDTGPQSSSSSF